MDISIIVPLYNEAESLPKLYEWIARVMQEHGYRYEILFVNDGEMFGKGGEGFMRMNVGCPRAVLQEALERLVGCAN